MITVRQVAPDDADAHRLWKAQERDLAERYDDPDLVLETDFPTLVGSWVGYSDEGDAIATLVARWSPYAETRPGDLELKRLWVEPEHRGHGHSRVMMGVAEAAARRAGATRLILETGTEQPEAIALYERLGYQRIAKYGEYAEEPDSICFGYELPTRVLVVNGTIGAGKSVISAAVQDLLAERGARTAHIEADALCQAAPAPRLDEYNQELLFDNLRAIAPHYRDRGWGLVVIPRVVEDPADRAQYAAAFSSAGGSAEVTVVRIDADEDQRRARLEIREPEGPWREWALARTVELDEVLTGLDLDDAVVDNGDGRDRQDVAAEVLERIGW